MSVHGLHPLNMHWLIGDPSEMRALAPTIYELYVKAMEREGAVPGKLAVIIGAMQSPLGACLFDTEVITPTHDSPTLRPTYNTIFLVCDAIKDLIAKGPPMDPKALQAIYARTREFLDKHKRDVRAAHLLAEAATLVIHGAHMPEDALSIAYYPDGRLFVLPTLLLRELVLAFLEEKSSHAI
jgi:hypothetical protein